MSGSLATSASPAWEILTPDPICNREYDLFNSLVSEKTDIAGYPIMYYIHLNPEEADELYGEDTTEEFTSGYRTKIEYRPEEEIQMLGVFGMTSDETLQYVLIPKAVFSRDVETPYLINYPSETEYKPRVGDTIKTLWNNKLYEIVERGSEQQVFQARKLIWEFILKPYRHSEESDSADDMLFYDPDDTDFPDINETTITQELSAFGDNSFITEAASGISPDPDSSVYGY